MTEESLYKKYHREHVQQTMLDMGLFGWLLSYLKPYRGLASLSILFLLVAKAIEAFVPIYIGKMAQQIIDGASQSGTAQESVFAQVTWTSLWIIGFLLIAYFFDTVSMVIKNWIGQKALYTLRMQVYEHIQQLPLVYFDRHPVGRLITRTIHDIDQIHQMITDSLVPIIGSIILFICICIAILIMDWRIALLFGCIIPIVGWLTMRFSYYQRYWYDVVRSIVAAMNTFVQEHLMGSSTIRNFGLQQQEKKQFDELNEDYRLANLETIHHFSYFVAGIDLLQGLSLISAFVILVLLSPPGTGFHVGSYFAFSLYALMFFRPLTDLAERYNILQSAMSSAARVQSIFEQPIELKEIDKAPLEEIETISFEDVWFAYENENWVLKGLSFQIKKGESLALVGVTGAGKTTISNLLLRFYELQKGSIKINGRDIRDYSLHSLRKHFSIVLQDPVIFSGTILDNITLYQSHITPEHVDSVINYVNLRPFIERFPQGLHHKLTERGESLSMGERELLSLARAVAHERDVLILDEATANIDSITEYIIQDALKKILKQKTALVIAHRLSTIKDVQNILVLHNGVVAEMGTHQQLLDRKGLYEKLYRIQFA